MTSLCLVFTIAAKAEPHIFVPSDDLATGMLQNMLAGRLLARKQDSRRSLAGADSATVLKEVQAPVMPQRLASGHPEGQRAAVARAMTKTLSQYRRLERQLGLPRHDVGGALASFVASHWAAYRDTPVSTDDHARLVVQMRALLAQEPSFRNASPLEQQALYELLAIAGMRTAAAHQSLQQHPDAAAQQRLRQAAGTALWQLLGADPERLRWSAEGLQVAAAKAP